MTIKNLGYALVGFLSSNKKSETKPSHEDILYVLKLKAERELFREAKLKRAKSNGDTLKAIESANVSVQEKCNHRKGGNGLTGIVKGYGDSNQYAVAKHRYHNGDTHIRCLRCAKTWMPGDADYDKALNFQTHNVTSTDALVASVLPDGKVTADFAEAHRKWTNARAHRGVAFNPTLEKAKGELLQKELSEAASQEFKSKINTENPRKPFVIGKTLKPFFYTAESGDKMYANLQFNVIDNNQPNVS